MAHQQNKHTALSNERFWNEIMFDYHWKPLFSSSDRQHTDRMWTVHDAFDLDSTEIMSLRDRFLTCYFAFLFKLNPNETDLCVGMYVKNRSTTDL